MAFQLLMFIVSYIFGTILRIVRESIYTLLFRHDHKNKSHRNGTGKKTTPCNMNDEKYAILTRGTSME